jgi:hypothetical protein
MKISIFLSTLIFCSVCISCGDDDQGLSSQEKTVLDSLYGIQSQRLRLMTDSLCNLNKDTLFKSASDSILKVRMKEIDQLLMKTP